MKYLPLILPGLALALSSCDMQAQPNYTLTFPAPQGTDGSMAYLVDWDNGAKVDSVVVGGDTIRFEGKVDAPFIGRLMIGGARGPVMFVEPGAISVDANGMATGTPLNDRQTASIAKLMSFEEEYRKLNQNDSVQRLQADSIARAAQDMPAQLYKENASNLMGLYWFLQRAYEMPLADVEAEAGRNPMVGNSARIKSVIEAARKREMSGVGKHYLDFTVDYDGKAQKFSDYVKPGEYTLVDFWASWCGPCMRQAKVIKELYNRYKGKGLNVVGVAVWDEPEATLGAIKSHGLEWPNIINAQTVPTDLYGINGIPCIILINPDGIIVSRDKQGQDLVDDVDKFMSSYEPVSEAPDTAMQASADTASVIF